MGSFDPHAQREPGGWQLYQNAVSSGSDSGLDSSDVVLLPEASIMHENALAIELYLKSAVAFDCQPVSTSLGHRKV
jgi:hypothetical protein